MIITRSFTMQLSKNIKKMQGFTLLELMAVIVIIGLLAGLIGPAVMDRLGGAKTDTAKTQISQLATALNTYAIDMNKHPSSTEGLKALVEKQASKKWRGPYLTDGKLPKDPWDRDYIYKSPGENGRKFDIISYGADGQAGGEGENADIHSYD